jgi:hypothetical protein
MQTIGLDIAKSFSKSTALMPLAQWGAARIIETPG